MGSFAELGIDLKGKTTGQHKTLCPKCSHTRRKNPKEPCLSVNIDEEVYKCWHCGWEGGLSDSKLEYKRPDSSRLVQPTSELFEHFRSRGISREVVQANGVSSSNGLIVFPYKRRGELINYKAKSTDKKKMMQAKEAEAIMFNYDRCIGQKSIIINEGEEDSMAWEMAGITYHTSVNQGAPNENDTNIDKKLMCIDNCIEMFDSAETIYLGADNDANGRRLNKELARRFGAEKCKTIDYGVHKDANDVLLQEGTDELLRMIKDAKDVPISGVFKVEDLKSSLIDRYRNGKPRGSTTHINEVDNAWTWKPGEVTLWTGYNNEGKSQFLEFLSVAKAYWDGWKGAWFSPENTPVEDFFDDIIEIFVGKSCDKHYEKSSHYMNQAEYESAIDFVNRHYFNILPDIDFTLDNLFEKARYLVRKKGIRYLVIDPYNWVEHKMKPGEREDLYISRFMAQLKNFAKVNDVSVHLVAHQNTPTKDSGGRYLRPSKYTIKGGGTFSDKTDNVNFVWRPDYAIDFTSPDVVFGSQKIKKQKLVGRPQDVLGITYHLPSGRYLFNGKDPFSDIDRDRKGVQKEIEEDPFGAIQPNMAFDDLDEEDSWQQFKD
jgi:twinkle protein